MFLTDYLIILISSFIMCPVLSQLAVFKDALLCYLNLGVLSPCRKSISGIISIELEILCRENEQIIKTLHRFKEPACPLFLIKN